ncbi:hypothetical protein PUN28_004591 [Cardiocondyla obscurior]|uniref:Uncharacterized protein n=1 Tax=Cardiocondyla obscurior TaxID=286306 RepID=A0AAW2GEM1_9HYME
MTAKSHGAFYTKLRSKPKGGITMIRRVLQRCCLPMKRSRFFQAALNSRTIEHVT